VLHPRHRLADRRRRHAKLPSREREASGFRRLNKAFSDPRLSIREPPQRTFKSDMFGTMAHFSNLWESSSLASASGIHRLDVVLDGRISQSVTHPFHHWQWRRRF